MRSALKKKRALQAEASKNRIYDVSIELIAENGYEETSILDICERAGCSVGAFYHHFGSKNGIIEEIFRRADDRFANFSHNELPQTNGRERVTAYLARYASFVAKDIGLDLSKRLYSCENKLFIKKGRAMQTELTEIIDSAKRSGELNLTMSAEEACEWLFVGARGIAFQWCLCDGNFDIVEMMKTYTRRALRGIET